MSLFFILFLSLSSNAAEIHEYVKQEDLQKITSYLKKGGNPNLPDEKGYPPLYYAIEKNSIPIAQLFIQYRANVNARVRHKIRIGYPLGVDRKPENYTSTCALLFAIPSLSSEILNMVRLLLNAGADANARCDNHHALLHEATIFNEMPLIKLLLESKYKADVSPGRWNGTTPLHIAVRLKYEKTVRFLIQKRANVNAKNHKGNTPLHAAAYAMPPHKEIIKLLVNNKADVRIRNNQNLRPIDIAKEFGHPQNIQQLLQKRNPAESAADRR